MSAEQYECQECDRCGKQRHVPIKRVDGRSYYEAEEKLGWVSHGGDRHELCAKCEEDFTRWIDMKPAPVARPRKTK